MTQFQSLIHKIHHGVNPYEGFPVDKWSGHWQDWGSTHEWFRDCIEQTRPKVIVEVGSYLGASAIHMAGIIKELKLDCAIICVDTWLGGIDHWTKTFNESSFWFGRPFIYYGFMSNVIQHQCHDVIVPLPLDSENASLLLEKLEVESQFIYIDGSHEEEQAYRDLDNYYFRILKGKGYMMVDDLTGHFPGVVEAFNRFVDTNGSNVDVNREKGRIWKD